MTQPPYGGPTNPTITVTCHLCGALLAAEAAGRHDEWHAAIAHALGVRTARHG